MRKSQGPKARVRGAGPSTAEPVPEEVDAKLRSLMAKANDPREDPVGRPKAALPNLTTPPAWEQEIMIRIEAALIPGI